MADKNRTQEDPAARADERVTGEDLLYEGAAAPDVVPTYRSRSAFTKKGAARAKVARSSSDVTFKPSVRDKGKKSEDQAEAPAAASPARVGALMDEAPVAAAQGGDEAPAKEESPFVTVDRDGRTKIDLDHKRVPKLRGKAKRREVLVAIFAVIIGVSMMLPSLSYIFAGAGASSDSQASEASASQDGSTDQASTTQDPTSLEEVDSQYQGLVTPLEETLQGNPDDATKLSTLLGLGDDYAKWGTAGAQFATTEEQQQHVVDLFNKAIDYYNQYLAINDSDAVRVRVAQCTMFSGHVDEGIAALEEMTQKNPDYALAYVYLGIGYAAKGDMTKAVNTFKVAEEKDPDNAAGAKSLAQSYEAYLAYYQQQSQQSTDGSSTGTTSVTDTTSMTSTTGTGMGALMNQLYSGTGMD